MADLQKLREQIVAGTYQVDAASIAGALLDYASIGDATPASDLARQERAANGRRPPGTARADSGTNA